MTAVAPTELPTSRSGRILGVDAARAVALVGMAATHILPLQVGGRETLTGLLADGRASALFAVLAGVGVSLSTGGTRPPGDAWEHLAAAAALVTRGALVALIGLWLVSRQLPGEPPVAVILVYYGLLFAVAAPLLRLGAGALAVGAVLACVLAPVASQLLRSGRTDGPGAQPGFAALAEPGQLLETLLLTGYYPVLPWTTYLLAGMAVGRLDLRRPRVAAGLLGGGAALALLASAVSAWLLGPGGGATAIGATALDERRYGTTPTDTWWWLAIDTPHTGTPLDLAHTTGTALAVLGAMLVLARVARPLVWVPAAVGAIPLTLYTVHVVAVTDLLGDAGSSNGGVLLTHVIVATAVGVFLALVGWRGPLEAVVSGIGRAVRRALLRQRPPLHRTPEPPG